MAPTACISQHALSVTHLQAHHETFLQSDLISSAAGWRYTVETWKMPPAQPCMPAARGVMHVKKSQAQAARGGDMAAKHLPRPWQVAKRAPPSFHSVNVPSQQRVIGQKSTPPSSLRLLGCSLKLCWRFHPHSHPHVLVAADKTSSARTGALFRHESRTACVSLPCM